MNLSIIAQYSLMGVAAAGCLANKTDAADAKIKGCTRHGVGLPRGESGMCPSSGEGCEAFCADLYNEHVRNGGSGEVVGGRSCYYPSDFKGKCKITRPQSGTGGRVTCREGNRAGHSFDCVRGK
ncbi:hypothetical protein XA68_11296 [Ophiocordyceps unilateralis]|uniref:Secreted protein n=1 Tax=Ophiocordyceps unilateralis TaxID=268505 RepID=A0A2A9PGT8_OPHUN|nr:hypothetical protein XA68_11296 [Ophiocordyceps unilateralis]